MVRFAIFGVSSSFYVVNTTTEARRTPLRFSGLVYSADGPGLMCVMNNSHRGQASVDIVYIAYTVV